MTRVIFFPGAEWEGSQWWQWRPLADVSLKRSVSENGTVGPFLIFMKMSTKSMLVASSVLQLCHFSCTLTLFAFKIFFWLGIWIHLFGHFNWYGYWLFELWGHSAHSWLLLSNESWCYTGPYGVQLLVGCKQGKCLSFCSTSSALRKFSILLILCGDSSAVFRGSWWSHTWPRRPAFQWPEGALLLRPCLWLNSNSVFAIDISKCSSYY